MAHSNDSSNNSENTKTGSQSLLPSDYEWVHSLARFEATGQVDARLKAMQDIGQIDPHQIVEESSIQFLKELKEQFGTYAKIFNSYSESSQKFNDVRIYNISNTASDFMLFRNNIKLVFSNAAHGIISATFLQHQREAVNIDGTNMKPEANRVSQEILAQIGPFYDVQWTYQGEKVSVEKLVRYYFIEFIKASRAGKKASAPNHLLLQQIKALLEGQGFEL